MSLPVPQPAYIFRGHASQVHATTFIRSNSRLVTGDAEGWIVVWSLAIKRPVAVWRAHEGSILGVKSWGSDKLITHGKDNKLVVWNITTEDEATMSKVLPVDDLQETRKLPWLLHVLHVNTLNFCSFAYCAASPRPTNHDELLIAVPNTLSSETVDVFQLPSEDRVHRVPNSISFKGGMIMALSIFHHPTTSNLTIISGFESGHTSISQLVSSNWQTTYTSHPHLQPILSLALAIPINSQEFFYLTSSADANITKHQVPSDTIGAVGISQPAKSVNTKHSGQQSLQIRNDGKIFATAGWDSRVRVYATKSLKELAVLKWHKEGCYAVAFADVDTDKSSARNAEVQAGIFEIDEGNSGSTDLVKSTKIMTVAEARTKKAESTHWLAVGSKDGKVSLWDIY